MGDPPSSTELNANPLQGEAAHEGEVMFPGGYCYKGPLTNGIPNGKGKVVSPNGSCFESRFIDGVPESRGKITWTNGDCYEGDIVRGTPDGRGKFTWENGDCYEGELSRGIPHGRGRTTKASGFSYEGDYVHGRTHGRGKYIFQSGEICEGVSLNGRIQSDLSNLKDPLFLKLLVGACRVQGVTEFPLGVISDFLCTHGYPGPGEELKSALRTYCAPEDESEKIHQKLQGGLGSLLVLRSVEHVMGLNFVPDNKSSGSVFLDVFNSGEGLEHHRRLDRDRGMKPKFQTLWRVKVPITSITPDAIRQWTQGAPFNTAADAYAMIRGLPEAEVVESDAASAVYQTAQKSGNCSLEWAFAWLKNRMPGKDYHEMRERLFSLCIIAIHEDDQMDPALSQNLLRELYRKKHKRMIRIHDPLFRGAVS